MWRFVSITEWGDDMNITKISVNDMKVDMSYQRTPNEKRIRRIAREWDDMQANLIYLSHRSDGYYVIDGNHTRLAYELTGGKFLNCRVYENLSKEDEARLYEKLNTSQKKPKFAEILKARIEAGDQLATSYIQLLDDVGIKYSFTQSSSDCTIKCHAALLEIYKKTTSITMRRALSTAKKAADGRNEFYQVGFFPGLCDIVVNHPELDDKRLIDRVRKTSSSKVRDIADKYKRGASAGGCGVTANYRKTYIDIYNGQKTTGRIEE